MQLTSTLCALILAVTAVQATPSPIDFSKRDADFNSMAKRDASAAAEAWCGTYKHEMPCAKARMADAFFEATMVTKREAETSPDALADAWCGTYKHEMPCARKRAAEAIADAFAEAEANPQPLPDADAFAEAWCGTYKHEMPCAKARAAEAVPEAWCGTYKHEMPCAKKREDLLRREYVAALALRDL